MGSPSLLARPRASEESDLQWSQVPGGETDVGCEAPQSGPAPCQYDLIGLDGEHEVKM